jgi:hypothetical protein
MCSVLATLVDCVVGQTLLIVFKINTQTQKQVFVDVQCSFEAISKSRGVAEAAWLNRLVESNKFGD